VFTRRAAGCLKIDVFSGFGFSKVRNHFVTWIFKHISSLCVTSVNADPFFLIKKREVNSGTMSESFLSQWGTHTRGEGSLG
jgi:hypothetical protein